MKLICPVCKIKLSKKDKEVVCENNHHFDYAKQGYLNLYLSNKPIHGDNAQMVISRTNFLNKGYYQFLKERLTDLTKEYHPDVLVDLGCGEGYYTDSFLANEKYGFDLSKSALKHASKKDKSTQYVISSIFHLPLADHTCDLAITCFAPAAIDELQRILKPGGKFIYVTPGPDHLFQMKEALYDTPYKNPQDNLETSLKLINDEIIEDNACIDNETIQQLFQMTPYVYKTSISSTQCLKMLDNLDITLQFRIRIYEKLS